jgi:RNA polymerase sigma-70 factor (ECF subfamily)
MAGIIDNEQFLMLLTAHQRRLMGYVQSLVPNRLDAEDLLQEVNLYLCRHAGEFQLGTDFTAWALRIAYFRVVEWRERDSRNRLIFDDSLIERLAVAAQGTDSAGDKRRDALEECLQKLAQNEREMITQFYGESKETPQELATRIGRSIKGVYVSVYRIRIKLFDCIRRSLASEERNA